MSYNCKFLICLCLLQHIKYLNIQVPECYYAPFLPLFLFDANEAFLSSPPSSSSALISLSSSLTPSLSSFILFISAFILFISALILSFSSFKVVFASLIYSDNRQCFNLGFAQKRSDIGNNVA